MKKAIIYIQLQNDLHPCFWSSLKKTREHWDGEIILVAPQRELSWPQLRENDVTFVSEELFENDPLILKYNELSFFNRIHKGWNGFWDNACKRFMYMYLVQKKFNIDSCLHIETDVVPYMSLNEIVDKCSKIFNGKIVFSKHAHYQISCCTVYSGSIDATKKFCDSILEYFQRGHEWFLNKYKGQTIINETHFSYTFCEEHGDIIALFPTMPGDKNHEELGVLIDPTAWGMYVDGLHRNPGNSYASQYHYIGEKILTGHYDVHFKLNGKKISCPYVYDIVNKKSYLLATLHFNSKRSDLWI